MTTPVHETTTTGSLGEHMAQVIFSKIRWAPPTKLEQDVGTDLVTFARDPGAPGDQIKAWDLGAPVFVQVKGSPEEYLKPANTLKGKPGWWFTESETYHFDHWLSFGLPYLLVLVDTENQIAYWAEVTGDAIVSTGKGRKIFVPFAQTVDNDSVEALTKIAVSRRKYALEGTAWEGKLNDLGPADRLRTALMIPRVVAPHGNRPVEKVTFEEAVAMVLRNRYSELAHRGRQGQCPQVEHWENHKDWGWRFVHALRELITTGSSKRFGQLAAGARHRFERDACLVIQACVAYTGNNSQAAIDLLVPSGRCQQADRGWLLVHKAAFLFELDKPREAADAAKKALVATKSLDGDLSANSIRGAAASILFTLAGFGDGDLEATITAQDHPGNWWRDQDVASALEKDLKYRFEGWTANNTTHFINSTARDDLATVAWNAGLSGAWSTWRHLTMMNAKLALTTTVDPVGVAAALEAFIFIGDKQAAGDAAYKMWQGGPTSSLHFLVHAIAEREWSKRDEGASMAVLAKAGDLLQPRAADLVVQRVLDLLANNGNVRVHGGGWSYRWNEADGALARVLMGASAKSHKKVADLIAADFATCSDAMAHSYTRLAFALNVTELGVTRIKKLCKVASTRGDDYGIGLFEVLGRVSADAINELRKKAANGNSTAIRSLLVAGSTDHDDFIALGKNAAKTVRTMVENARGKDGTRAIHAYVNDPLDDLVLAARSTNNTKLWKEVTDALEACVIEQTQQQGAIRRLAWRFPDLPPHVQRKLRTLAPDLTGSSFGSLFGQHNEFPAAVTHLRIAAGTVPDLEVEGLLLSERRTDPVGFIRTLAAWNSERKLPFLATMIVDENPTVRSQAGFSLVEHADRYPVDRDRAHAVIRSALLQEEGCALLDGLAQGLAAYPTEALADIEHLLRHHASAQVRGRFLNDG